MRDLLRMWLTAAALVGCASSPAENGEAEAELSQSRSERWNAQDEQLLGPQYTGDNERGSLFMPLWRGTGGAFEDLVYAPPDGDCTKVKGTVRVQWDKKRNTVRFTVKYRGMPQHPTVHRTEGVDFVFNPFHKAAKDIEDGAYKFWILLPNINPPTTTFYYDAETLALKGSEYDFPLGPPAGTFPLTLPDFVLIASKLMTPDDEGFISHSWTVAYDHLTTEGGHYSGARAAFVPHDLCRFAPSQPVISQLRPYVTRWLLPNEMKVSWESALTRGINFDTTVDERGNQNEGGQVPYIYSSVAFIGNIPAFNGGVPNGAYGDIESAIANVQPAYRLIPGGNGLGCHTFVSNPNHITAPRFCEGER